VRRFSTKSFILGFALLSYLMTATLVHIPMAYASEAITTEASGSPPCAAHAGMQHMSSADAAAVGAHQADHSGDPHPLGCKSGLCKCPCAHASAVESGTTQTLLIISHFASAGPEQTLLAPDCATPVFRPPI
jgi:hypothetical protein